MVKLLMDAAPNTSFVDSEGRSPLHIAVQTGHINIVRVLFGFEDGSSPGRSTPRFDPNAQDNNGCSCLHLAVEGQKTALVELLLDFVGINVELKDCSGRTPLHLAVLHEHLDIAQMLLEKGADLTAQIG
jgi:ankyrin repeat protein